MMRFLKLLAAQITLMAEHAGKVLLTVISTIFFVFFGRFKWQAPAWLRKTGESIGSLVFWGKRHLKTAVAILVAVVILIAAGIYGHHWYINRPKPYMVAYSVSAPTLTNPDITIRFQDSVAPIEMINQPVTTGISMTPQMTGEWHWANDRTLQFKPKTEWPADKAYNVWPIHALYEVSLDEKNLLRTGALLEKYKFNFSTPVFEVKNFSAYLYHDPTAPDQKKTVATMAFTHPLNKPAFEKLVSLELSKGLRYNDTTLAAPEFYYSEDGREVYIHSGLLATPLENSKVTLFIDKGIVAQAGGNKTSQPYSTQVSIPGLYQLTFSQNQIFFADNEKGEPEPVFAFESSHPVTDEAVKNQVTAWLLPPKDSKGHSWSVKNVSETVLKQSQKIELTQIESDNPQNTMHAFKFKIPPGRQMYVQVNAGIKATGGYIARNQTVFLRTMPDYPTELSFLSDGALLNLNGDRDLGIMARGVQGARVEVARILPRQLHILVDQLDGSFTRPRGRSWRVAWKTGTSWGYHDAWTAGIVGPYVLIVWVGNFDGASNPAFIGIKTAAPLFFRMADALQLLKPGIAPAPNQPPAGVSRIDVCAVSGDLPNAWCPQTKKTWFIPGVSPIRVSTLHQPVMIDTRTGQVARPPYDPEFVREEVYEFWPSDMRQMFAAAGLPRRQPPQTLSGDLLAAVTGENPRIDSPISNVTYTLKINDKSSMILLQAHAAADVKRLYWFNGQRLLGQTGPGESLEWRPEYPGWLTLSVTDERGRTTTRRIQVEFIP